MIPLPPLTRIFLACGATDMRKGFDGLAVLVQQALEQSPHSGALFAFRGKRGDLVKPLWYDGQGLCLFSHGSRPVYLAVDRNRLGRDERRTAFDAAGRHRLATTGAYIYTVAGRLKMPGFQHFFWLAGGHCAYIRGVGRRTFRL